MSEFKRKKRICFTDFWGDFHHSSNFFTILLKENGYDFEVNNQDCDVEIFSVFGHKHLNCGNNPEEDKRSIYFVGEPHKDPIPGLKLNLTFDHSEEHNNIRVPLWLWYGYNKDTKLTKKNTSPENFCCFVVTSDVPKRTNFCRKLMEYKPVGCGGEVLNNIGGRLGGWSGKSHASGSSDNREKIEWQTKFKFCLAFENSSKPGYVTEKILEAYKSNCIPIYWGSEKIAMDFNPETFINAHDFETEEDLIEYIKKVDTDDELYASFMEKPIYSEFWLDVFNNPQNKYFANIADRIMKDT